MKITLYKNCILSARNTEVFRTQALLETYLNTLQKPYSGSDIQINNTYAMIRGTLQLDISNFNGDFNYIKFEDINNKKWYAFVDSFSYVDTLLIINYTQDIWHTYLGQWSLRESLVIRSNHVKHGEPYEMPLNYINNGEITVAKLKSDNDTDNTKYAIIVKLQLFDLVSGRSTQGVVWEGYTAYSFVNYSTTPTSFTPINSLNSVADVLDSMQEKQNEKHWRPFASANDFYARIVETYIIPANWLENSSIFASNINDSIKYVNNGNITFYNCLSTSDLNIKRLLRTFELYDTMTREETKLMLSFGTYTSQIPYSFDGINKKIKLYLSSSRDELSFYIDYDGHTIDITQQFIVLQDYTATTPDVLAQREIARKIQTVKGITGIINNATNILTSAANMAVGGADASAIQQGAGRLAAFNQMELATKLGEVGASKVASGLSSAAGIVGGITGIVNNVTSIAAANAKKYMTFNTSNNDTKAYINAYFGLCYMYAENIVNDYEVVKAINEVGYSVNYFTNDLDLGLSIYTDNVIQFGFVRLVGLSTEICEMLANILTSGVKIWYTANV